METTAVHHRTRLFLGLALIVSLVATLVALSFSNGSGDSSVKNILSQQAAVANTPNVANPELPADVCQSLQVLVLVDRSGSVTDQGAATVQKYKDQVKKVWHTLNNISRTYGGFSSGYTWAFAGRTADQMPQLLARDNNGDGTVNEEDRNLNDLNVLAQYDQMTQNIYFDGNGSPAYPSNQLPSYGYNPKSEDTRYFTKIQYTNWHEAFLMAQDTVIASNAPLADARDYSLVIMITDGEPTVNDGPNHTWDKFARRANIDENHDGYAGNSKHSLRTKEVIDALRSGVKVNDSATTFNPVQVYGVLIGGGSSGATRMSNTFGTGNWFQSADFDSTLGTQLLNVVGSACPPAGGLSPAIGGEFVSSEASAIENSQISYVVDITNTGTAILDEVEVPNASVIPIYDDANYSNEGLFGPGMKRRFLVSYFVPGGATAVNVNIPFSANVAEDPSLLLPGSPTTVSGELNTALAVQLIPRPA
jgi:hypothetical protein